MVELKLKEKPKGIRVDEMKDGDIGVITVWGCNKSYLGQVVQRCHDTLIAIGKAEQHSWPEMFVCNIYDTSDYRVKLLKKGDKLVVVENY